MPNSWMRSWRFAIPIAALVVVAAVLVFFGMTRSEGSGPSRAFYAEVSVEVEPGLDDPLADLRGPSRSVVRWWYAPDPNRWRWEVETVAPPLDAGTALTVFDGDQVWSSDASSAHYRRAVGPRDVVLPPTFSAPVGPANIASMEAFLEHWRGANESVEITGEATILGRSTEIVEIRPAWHTSSSAATASAGDDPSSATPTSSTTSGGVIRAYLDPERMFIMRWEVDGEGGGQSYRAEITRLDYDGAIDGERFAFHPAAGASEVTDDDATCTRGGGLQDSGPIQVPEGFLSPVSLPDGFRHTSAGAESAPAGCGVVAAWSLLEDDSGRRILLRQRMRTDGISAALRSGDPIEVGAEVGYRAQHGAIARLVWSYGDVVALLDGDGVPFEVLYELARDARPSTASDAGTGDACPVASVACELAVQFLPVVRAMDAQMLANHALPQDIKCPGPDSTSEFAAALAGPCGGVEPATPVDVYEIHNGKGPFYDSSPAAYAEAIAQEFSGVLPDEIAAVGCGTFDPGAMAPDCTRATVAVYRDVSSGLHVALTFVRWPGDAEWRIEKLWFPFPSAIPSPVPAHLEIAINSAGDVRAVELVPYGPN